MMELPSLPPSATAEERMAYAQHWYACGAALRPIAAQVGVSHETVRIWLRRAGVALPGRPTYRQPAPPKPPGMDDDTYLLEYYPAYGKAAVGRVLGLSPYAANQRYLEALSAQARSQ